MKRKMTVVFKDENLYTQLKIEAVKLHSAASDIVSEAVREWLESREDSDLLPVIKEARKEWEMKGGRSWEELEKQLESDVEYQPSIVKDAQD